AVLPSSIALPPLEETPAPPAPPRPVQQLPTSASIPTGTPVAANTAADADIQKILSQVKLPERRDFKAAADTKIPEPPAPKNLAAMVVKPPTDAPSAQASISKPEAAGISSVHTLRDDLQHAVKENKMSLVRAVSLEQDKKRTEMIDEDFGRRTRHKRIA